MTEAEGMARAIRIATRGWGRVHPNPLVGAVLLRDGRMLAEGWHAEFGGPHAEVEALSAARDAAGATMVVTLEPCAHRGKTPPCADALIAAGVRRVVYAVSDPNPTARGGGRRLRAAGVDVADGLLAERAAAMNAPFLCSTMAPGRPFVALKLAVSRDGFLASPGGRREPISGEVARRYVYRLRAGFDAIGVGRRTAEMDDPQLTARGDLVPRVAPTRLIFSRSGNIDQRLAMLRSAGEVPTLLVTVPGPGPAGGPVPVLAAPSLREALGALRERGMQSLLLEGGGTLAAAFVGSDLVDRLYLIHAPHRLGAGQAAFGRFGTTLPGRRRWTAVEHRALGRDRLEVLDRKPCLPAS